MSATRWLATYESEGEVRFRVGRAGDVYVAEWVGLARVTSDRSGAAWEVTFDPDAGPRERAKLTSGGLHLLRRQLEGKLALHGSAVAFGDRAVVMLGGSGQGKSTLATALCQARGALLADDACAVDVEETRTLVRGTETAHWLDEASRRALGLAPIEDAEVEKAPIAARASAPSATLAAIVELAWSTDDAPSLRPLSGFEALARVLPHVVRMIVDDPDLARRELDQLERLLGRTPAYVLARPRALDRLGGAVDMLRSLCSNPNEVSR